MNDGGAALAEYLGVRRLIEDGAVLLDIRFLIEHVTSPVWAWTARVVDGLLRSLDLAELPARPNRNERQFEAASGLLCTVIADDVTRNPVRIEFPFEILPMTGASRAEVLEAHFAMLCAAVEGALGLPSTDPNAIISSGLAATGRASWRLHACTMAVEAQRATEEFGDRVVLSLEKQDIVQQADAQARLGTSH